jgi:hypothetical protein
VANNTATIADELRRQADCFVDLTSLQDEIARERVNRPARDDDDDYDDEDDYYDDDEEEFTDDEDDDFEDDKAASGRR